MPPLQPRELYLGFKKNFGYLVKSAWEGELGTYIICSDCQVPAIENLIIQGFYHSCEVKISKGHFTHEIESP